MKQIKVLFVLHKTVLMGGGTKSFLVMLKGLQEKGILPIVAMPDREGVYSVISEMNIPTIITPYYDTVYPWIRSAKDVLFFLPRIILHRTVNFYAIRKIAKVARNENISLVHTNVSICTIGYWVARHLNVPHVYHIREYADTDFGLYHFPSRKYFYRLLSASKSYNICITKDIQRHFYQANRTESRVIYNGIQPGIDVMPNEPKKNYFLFAGRIVEAKGVMDMLQAYANYTKKTAHTIPLYIIGEQPDPAYYNKLAKFVKQNHLEDFVKFFGQRSDIREFMLHARAIIIPSRNEGFGRCMPEAMFCGCLAIGRNTGGTREQLDNGLEVTGEEIALRYDSEKQLNTFLHDISNNSVDYYNHYKERAFRTVNQLYSSESNVNIVYQFYHFILNL